MKSAMCGITGFSATPTTASSADSTEGLALALQQSLQTLSLRGPDHQATLFNEGVGFGHARLSIIDLSSSAHQPMVSPCGNYSIVFNGEIFNYLELKENLGKSGISFKTESDTEVLLHLLIRDGEKALKNLKGFFAFAFHDHREKSLLLARDHVGIKPLLYSAFGDQIFFASELKALLKYPIPKVLDYQAVHAFFELTYVPAPLTILKHVRKLRPGHYLKWKNSKFEERPFFTLETDHPKITDYAEAQKELKKLVDQACKRWMISDAPLGAFLSGGIDSSIVVALASQHTSKLKTYSIGFADSNFHDETQYSDLVAKRYRTDHTKIILKQSDFENASKKALHYLDEPFADTSAIPTYALCQAVGKEMRVALSGDGADELFGGYERYQGELLARKLRLLSPLAGPAKKIFDFIPQSRNGGLTDLTRKADRFLGTMADSDEDRYWSWCRFNSQQSLTTVFSHSFLKKHPFFSLSNLDPIVFRELDTSSIDDLNEILFKDILNVLPNDMLTKVDLMSMASSLEVRPLFLDQDIVDFSTRLPAEFKLDSKRKKKILVDAFKDLLPEEVYNRPKHGFSIDLEDYLQKQFAAEYHDALFKKEDIERWGIFDYEKVVAFMKRKNGLGKKDYQSLAWSLITFQSFLKKYLS